ncbi:MAG: DUF5686 and carboxypeptidase regulatory-like domain-containing protein [Bacteroidia bacterium]
MSPVYRITLFFLACTSLLQAAGITGTVTDEQGHPLAYASIYIKGTTKGTNSNLQGAYKLDLPPGSCEIIYKYLGYKPHTEHLEAGEETRVVNVKLEPEVVQLRAAVIDGNAEDPAYAIIRQAQKQRKHYLEQVDAYSCDVYIKGVQRLLKIPSRIMGKKVQVQVNGVIDTTSGIIYLSESVSRFNFKQNSQIREEMISSKVSGDNKAFSYNQASDMLFNFYENLLVVPSLSDRGFISPLASNAMLSYRYKMIGTFYEEGQAIHKIQVIPRRKNDPVFSGTINIMDSTWRIHSLELFLTKDSQIEWVDTLHVNQVFVPVKKDVWMIISNRFNFSIRLFGMVFTGTYIGLNSNYVLNPEFPPHYFNNELLHIQEDANKKDTAYWNRYRPVPLTVDEKKDYRRKDSIQVIRDSRSYKDSADRKHNRFHIPNLLMGYTHDNTFKHRSWTLDGPLQGIEFNTVQGFNPGSKFSFRQGLERNRSYTLGATAGYGFSNKDFYGSLFGNYSWKPEAFAKLSYSAGKEYAQFNGNNPILPLINSLYSLLNGQNYLKLYSKNYVNLTHSSELFNGFYLIPGLEYAKRSPLNNRSDDVWIKSANRYTSNDPVDSSNHGNSFAVNNALTLGIQIKYVIKQGFYTMPHEKILSDPEYPILFLTYKKGLALPGSDMDYDFISLGLDYDLSLKLLGNTSFSFKAGTFPNSSKMYFMDWYHFSANQTLFSRFATSDFQLLPYYTNSTNTHFVEGHIEHYFGGFIFNKIPLLKKLKLEEIIKASAFSTDGKNIYSEFSAGIERFKFRVDFVEGFSNGKQISTGIRLGMDLY